MRTPFLDEVFGFITSLGEEAIGIAVICAVLWCVNKQTAYGIGFACLLSGLTVQGMKISFRIERPWLADPTLIPVQSAIDNAGGYSFPSGHTQNAVALYGSFGATTKRKAVKFGCFAVAASVAFSRLYLGVHTPMDVIVSILISSLFILLTVKVLSNDSFYAKRALLIFLSALFYAALVVSLAVILRINGIIGYGYMADSLKAAGAAAGFAVGMYIERKYIKFNVEAGNIIWQIIKYITGMAGVLLIHEGLKYITGAWLAADVFRYFLTLMWITVLFPLLIKKFMPDIQTG